MQNVTRTGEQGGDESSVLTISIKTILLVAAGLVARAFCSTRIRRAVVAPDDPGGARRMLLLASSIACRSLKNGA